MDAQIYEVPKLQDICFNTFYKKVLCKATPTTVDFVQNCFHQQLMGTMRKTIRERCIEMLNDDYFTEESENGNNQEEDAILVTRDVCAILDSTLDDCFTNLEISIPYSTVKLFPLVMSIISRRSPQLEKLAVIFCTIKPTPILAEMEVQPAAVMTSQSDSRLNCLTKLSLLYSEHAWNGWLVMYIKPQVPLRAVDGPSQSILGTVAKVCPTLSKLDIFGFHVRKQDLFDLLLGEWNEHLFPSESHQWSDDSTIKGLKVPKEFLTPLCFTLKKLRFNWDRDADAHTPSDSMCTFVLRHLPHLEEFLRCAESVEVVKAFYKTEMIESKQAEFEEHCRYVADRIGQKRKLSGLFSFLPDGHLSLIRLNKVTIDDVDTLRAIAFLCPNLRKVTFIQSSVSKSPSISLDVIESIFKKWPKLVVTTVNKMDPAYINLILSAFGPHLNILKIWRWTQIDLQAFAYCTALERLSLIDGCSFKLKDDGDVAPLAGFLPALNFFYSDSCLGPWSRFFETKSTLTSLRLNCCHIATEAGLTRLEWDQMPEIWQRLDCLELRQSTGLSTTILSNLLPKLRQLQRVVLPISIMQREPVLFQKMVQELSEKYEVIRHGSDFDLSFCPYQQHI